MFQTRLLAEVTYFNLLEKADMTEQWVRGVAVDKENILLNDDKPNRSATLDGSEVYGNSRLGVEGSTSIKRDQGGWIAHESDSQSAIGEQKKKKLVILSTWQVIHYVDLV